MDLLELVIGNKNYSSWSLRPWILLKNKSIPFSETRVPLYIDGSHEELLKQSDSAKVPVLKMSENVVWDSLAICETIAELFPEKACWPDDAAMRAEARAISCEMHSSFSTLRDLLPMNCRRSMVYSPVSAQLQNDIDRVQEIWSNCRERFHAEGDFLFGKFTIADAMFAPVVLRFNSYGIERNDVVQDYMTNMLSLPELQDWIVTGQAESEHMPHYEVEAS